VSARDRLLDTACELFYREGIQAVGIQRLIEEAGIAKASLYAHFPTKDDLVVAYLQHSDAALRDLFTNEVLAAPLPPREKLLKLFDVQAEQIAKPGYRGCPFQNAGGELADAAHPARAVAASHREWMKGVVTDLVKEAGVERPAALVEAILVLFEGASARGMVEGNAAPSRHARWAAEQLIDAALPHRSVRKSSRSAR
jgi:AcrR family transcriptional regulator